jgi:hypothetical protein
MRDMRGLPDHSRLSGVGAGEAASACAHESNQPERLKGREVECFYLDRQGRIISIKTHSAAGSKRGEETVARFVSWQKR